MSKNRNMILAAAITSTVILSACNQVAPVKPEAKTTTPAQTSSVTSTVEIKPANQESVTGSISIVDPNAGATTTPTTDATATDATTPKVAVPTTPATDAKSSLLVPYTSAKLAELKGKQPVALFFHAAWCPICRAMEQSIKGEPELVPAGITLLKVDYDTEEALKKEFNIVQQSTWVILGANGKEVARNPGFEYTGLVADLKKAL